LRTPEKQEIKLQRVLSNESRDVRPFLQKQTQKGLSQFISNADRRNHNGGKRFLLE